MLSASEQNLQHLAMSGPSESCNGRRVKLRWIQKDLASTLYVAPTNVLDPNFRARERIRGLSTKSEIVEARVWQRSWWLMANGSSPSSQRTERRLSRMRQMMGRGYKRWFDFRLEKLLHKMADIYTSWEYPKEETRQRQIWTIIMPNGTMSQESTEWQRYKRL